MSFKPCHRENGLAIFLLMTSDAQRTGCNSWMRTGSGNIEGTNAHSVFTTWIPRLLTLFGVKD